MELDWASIAKPSVFMRQGPLIFIKMGISGLMWAVNIDLQSYS